MQAFAVVEPFDERADPGGRVGQISVFGAIDLFVLERLHERFALGVVAGVAGAAHTNLDAVGLLCLRKRRFVMTTDSDHGLPVYPNLARHLVLTGIDQLWVADLTYIRLVAGSRRPDFPNQSERMLLDVIANRAVIDLQQAISVDEHKQLAQRNATLIAENEQLKREIAKRKLADEALQISQNAFSNIIDTIPTTLGRRALTATANS